jgi:hypothetical protein
MWAHMHVCTGIVSISISKCGHVQKRGTGSRAVPHRLNSMERAEFDLAKQKLYVCVRGSGYRRERGDSPLCNIFRQRCDALAIPCVSIERVRLSVWVVWASERNSYKECSNIFGRVSMTCASLYAIAKCLRMPWVRLCLVAHRCCVWTGPRNRRDRHGRGRFLYATDKRRWWSCKIVHRASHSTTIYTVIAIRSPYLYMRG